MVSSRRESLTHRINQMKLFNAIAAAVVIGASLIAANPGEAANRNRVCTFNNGYGTPFKARMQCDVNWQCDVNRPGGPRGEGFTVAGREGQECARPLTEVDRLQTLGRCGCFSHAACRAGGAQQTKRMGRGVRMRQIRRARGRWLGDGARTRVPLWALGQGHSHTQRH